MTLNQIMFRVASVYAGASVLDYWDMEKQKPRRSTEGGDLIAKFVAHEISESYDPSASDSGQVAAVVTAMQHGADRLSTVAHALANLDRERLAA